MQDDRVQVSARAVEPKETKLVPVANIGVVFRTRTDKGDIDRLVESIKTNGLINNIAIKETTEEGMYSLLAGERRLLAYGRLGKTEIMSNIYPADLSQLEKDLIELCENIDREDFTMQEEVDLKRRIHNAMQKKFGKKKGGIHQDSGHSMRDTAAMLGETIASTSADIKLSEAMEVMPELAKCKTKEEAWKMLKGLAKEYKRSEVAKRIEATKANTPEEKAKRELMDSYIIGDFFNESKNIPDGSIDLVEVDPPFGIDLNEIKKGHVDSLDYYNEWDINNYRENIAVVANECYRILSPNSWIVWWFAYEPWFEDVFVTLINAGFAGNRIPGIWVKPTGQATNPGTHLASATEPFFYMRKGMPIIERQGRPNHFDFRTVSPEKKIHPTEKPIELICDIYETFVQHGSRIVIPFLGSGVGLLAARNLGCTAFGWDLAQEYKDGFVIRVDEGDGKTYSSR